MKLTIYYDKFMYSMRLFFLAFFLLNTFFFSSLYLFAQGLDGDTAETITENINSIDFKKLKVQTNKNIENVVENDVEEPKEFFFEEIPPDFRGVYWGAKQEEVLQKELLTLKNKDYDRLVYQTDYLGYETFVYYLFSNNQLTNGQIVFPSNFHYPISRQELFLKIRERLWQQLGKPMLDESSRLTDDEKILTDEEIARGNFLYKVVWITQSSFVTLKLWGNSQTDKLYLAIFYTPNKKTFENDKKNERESFLPLSLLFSVSPPHFVIVPVKME